MPSTMYVHMHLYPWSVQYLYSQKSIKLKKYRRNKGKEIADLAAIGFRFLAHESMQVISLTYNRVLFKDPSEYDSIHDITWDLHTPISVLLLEGCIMTETTNAAHDLWSNIDIVGETSRYALMKDRCGSWRRKYSIHVQRTRVEALCSPFHMAKWRFKVQAQLYW